MRRACTINIIVLYYYFIAKILIVCEERNDQRRQMVMVLKGFKVIQNFRMCDDMHFMKYLNYNNKERGCLMVGAKWEVTVARAVLYATLYALNILLGKPFNM